MNPEIAKAIAAIRAQGGDDADVEAYLRSVGAQEVDPATAAIQDMNKKAELSARASEREAKSAEEKKLTGADRLGANLQRATDMATFGVSGLLDDLLSPGSFAANRQARRMAQEGLPTMDRVVSTLTGAVANPVGAVIRTPATAGLLGRMGRTSADAALQGGAQGAVENLDELSAEGLKRAGQGGLMGAAGGAAGVQALRGTMALARGANTMRRVAQAKPIDVRLAEMRDAMEGADNLLFGQAKQEAQAIGTTPEIRKVLASQTVQPYAQRVRNSEQFAGASDAEVFLEAYKGMSAAERAKLSQMANTADLIHSAQLEAGAVQSAKARMRTAVENDIPAFGPANAAHRANREQMTAFTDVADAVQRIVRKSAQKGEEKITYESPEALRRGIAKMTPAQAEVALEGLLGRTREVWKLSANPLMGFGVPGAAIRTAMAPAQLNPYIRLLEKQAGRKPRLFDNPVVMERGLGALARTTGSASGGLLDR